jgi:hypothetical protein
MDTHTRLEFDLAIGRLERGIHDLTAEQALSYIAHKALTQADGIYLYGLRLGLPTEYPRLLTSDTQLTSGFRRLVKWELLHEPTQFSAGGQGRPRAMYRRVDTPSTTLMLQQLAASWHDAPWNQKDDTNV